MSLFTNHPSKGYGYGTKEKAQKTLKLIKNKPIRSQWQTVNTLYNRAKYHKYQNEGMRNAMEIFEKWINKNKSPKK